MNWSQAYIYSHIFTIIKQEQLYLVEISLLMGFKLTLFG